MFKKISKMEKKQNEASYTNFGIFVENDKFFFL